MARYYAEGTIKKIVIDGEAVQFSLEPREEHKSQCKHAIRFIGEEDDSGLNISGGELFDSNVAADILLQLKRDHLPVRIYVEEGNMVDVKRMEIMN